MTTSVPTLYGIRLDSSRIFGIRHIDGLTFSQRRELINAATAYLQALQEPFEPTPREVPVKAPACGGYCDTDNSGICYTCGGYNPARDAGRII